jgi:hypothetical protein
MPSPPPWEEWLGDPEWAEYELAIGAFRKQFRFSRRKARTPDIDEHRVNLLDTRPWFTSLPRH